MTPSAVASIARWLSFWEVTEYVSEALVALGCLGEYVAEYTNWLKTDERKHALGRRSLIVLILGISVGLLSLIQTNALSGEVIGSLGDRAKAAGDKAAKASSDADSAIGKAKAASGEADAARMESSNAKDEASVAEVLARGARKEADSFEDAIKEAKRDAAEAKALLAEVRRLAADAENRAAEAERKVADRHITKTQLDRINNSLARWSGQDIRLSVVSVNGDGEMWAYGQELIKALGSIRGWSMILTAQGRNNGPSGLSVRINPSASGSDKALANDLVIALHDAGVQVSGPEPATPYGTMQGGGPSFVSGVFFSGSPTYDPKAAPNPNVAIEIGSKK